jgi:hypothetical protein
VRSRRDGAEIVTEIEAYEGLRAYELAAVNQAIPPATSGANLMLLVTLFKQAFLDTQKGKNRGLAFSSTFDAICLAALTKARSHADINYLAAETKIFNGLTLQGMVRDKFTAFCERFGLIWFFEGSTIYVYPFDQTAGNTPLVLSERSGLIGFPERLENGVIRFDHTLHPSLKMWTAHNLLTRFLDEPEQGGTPKTVFLQIGTVSHSGDTNGTDWRSTCEAYPVRA